MAEEKKKNVISIENVKASIDEMDRVVDKLKYNARLKGAWEKVRLDMIRIFGRRVLLDDSVLSPAIPVKVRTYKNGYRGVDAKELHAFLDNGREFHEWLETQTSEYGFDTDLDYITIEGDLPGMDGLVFVLEPSTAEQLAMVDASKKGHDIRQYYFAVGDAVDPRGFDRILKHLADKEDEKTP